MSENEQSTLAKLSAVLRETRTILFEYSISDNTLVRFDEDLNPDFTVGEFLSRLSESELVVEEDRWKAVGFFTGALQGPVELCVNEGTLKGWPYSGPGQRRVVLGVLRRPDEGRPDVLEGFLRDITEVRLREEELERKATRDSLTGLYNLDTAKKLADAYLAAKNPYASCGLLIADVDFFKNANDTYGHQFGDSVLKEFSGLLTMMFRDSDVIARIGGDEFVALLKDVDHVSLMKKAMQLVENARKLTFPDHSYSLTCSVGVCFLPENVSGYTFDQLFKNADWALYRAKDNGRNRYEFCDYLQRFELAADNAAHPHIDTRYLHGDIVSIAFEVFEKTGSFNEAVKLLMEVVGIRFVLDRITIIQTDVKGQRTSRQYQWVSERAPQVLGEPGSFTKEDFLTLFNGYDEHGTIVLQHDDMGAYSAEGAALLMQGGAKTVLYAAMYCEGRYTGAISYVTCTAKRHWSRQDRIALGELTKILSAHLAKNQALNASSKGGSFAEYDTLTGLLSFHRFREEVERLIVGGFATSHIMVYCDFCGFSNVNREYGYSTGDMLLKMYSTRVIGANQDRGDMFFARVVADRFVVFCRYDDLDEIVAEIRDTNESFVREFSPRYPKADLRIRAGVYVVRPGCPGASAAIDAANYARGLAGAGPQAAVKLYDEDAAARQVRESRIDSDMDDALANGRIQVYLQPRVSLEDRSIIGAEALVRWEQEDGSVLLPDDFVPLCERSGKVIDLDLFVLDRVASYMEQRDALGMPPLPVSVNASILHATEEASPERYREVLEKHRIDPSRIQIEFAESGVTSSIGSVRQLLENLQSRGISTTIDGFGANSSMYNELVGTPVSTVKLSRPFINACLDSKQGTYLLGQTVDMIKGLGFHVVCEGVETEEQARLLLSMGCEEGQGYLFSRPMPIDEFERLLPDRADS